MSGRKVLSVMNLFWLLPGFEVLRRIRIPGFARSGSTTLRLPSHSIVIAMVALCSAGASGSELGLVCLASNRQIQVTLTGGTGQWHRLEASANLLTWTGLVNLFPTNPVTTWTDSDATNFATRFYRSLPETPLERYVAAADSNYAYRLTNTIAGAGLTNWILDLTSQAWRSSNEVNRTLWEHWLIITKPNTVTNGHALLYINGGNNGGAPPGSADSTLTQLALATKTIVAELRMIPNQPLTFAGETTGRIEDELIAYSWDKFLRLGDETWPAQLAMTKAAVRALDTIQAFCASAPGGSVTVSNFVVAGASKRGWTTWLTAVVDKRVVAIIPMVIDLLNVQPSFAHHYSAYGFWAPAIQDYVDMHIPDWFDTTQFQALMGMIDPYAYRERLTLPKFMINASGDQFFLPDSAQFYINDLQGVKYLRYVPNTDHSLNSDARDTMRTCYQAAVTRAALPQFSWSLESPGVLRVTATNAPTSVNLWTATNASARDFRVDTIGKTWQSTALPDQGGSVYIATVPAPPEGWTAFFVELTWPGGLAPFKFTTQVYVIPDTLPFTYPP
jgi:PhoPQ-activated pathogenicity-related protein